MLQAPISDRKTKAEASSKTAEHLPEYEQSSQSIGGMGRFSKREASPTRQSQPLQQQENFAALQKTYGNQAVLRMKGRSPAANPVQGGVLQRKCACSNSAGSSGSCTECQSKQEGILQTKLQIGEVGDRYEQEADRVAEQVMRMPEPTIQPDVESEKEDVVQRKAIANSITPLQNLSTEQDQPSEITSIINEVLRSPGQPLDTATRTFFEPRFGHDFSRVRVHSDRRALVSAGTVGALAYTVGPDIVFGSGQYVPRSEMGRRLLAHELTHVVQQRQGMSGATIKPSPAREGMDATLQPQSILVAQGKVLQRQDVPTGSDRSDGCQIKIYSGKSCPESSRINTCPSNQCCPALMNHFAIADKDQTSISSFKGSCSGKALETRRQESELNCNWFYKDGGDEFLYGAIVSCPTPIS
jgi:Domain of unknown function (DUF4157)